LKDYLLQNDIWLLGYNNINYDNVLSQAFLESDLDNYQLVSTLYDTTQPIFNNGENQDEVNRLRRSYLVPNSDIMTMSFQSGFQKPLKMLAVMLGHDLVYEGNISSRKDYTLTELGYDSLDSLFEDKKAYNINDVLITDKFFTKQKKVFESRKNLSLHFNIDFYSDSESSIANKLVLRLYAEEVLQSKGITPTEELVYLTEQKYKGNTTKRERVDFKDCIINVPKFETKYLNSVLNEVLDSHWTPEYNFNKVIHIGNVIGKIGVGGIHLFNTDQVRDYNYLLNNSCDEKGSKLKSVQIPICYKNIPKGKSVREIDVASVA
jgi:hypothetical protein